MIHRSCSRTRFGVVLAGAAIAACGGALSAEDHGTGGDAGLVDAAPGSSTPGEVDATVGGPDGAAPVTDASRPESDATDVDADAGPSTCGPCAGSCMGTRCRIVLASAEAVPATIAVTSKGVYWTNWGQPLTSYAESAVRTVPLDGGTPITVASTPGAGNSAVVADEGLVVWTDGVDIAAIPTGSTLPPTTLAMGAGARRVAIDAQGIYWTAYVDDFTQVPVARRMERDGGSPLQLMSGGGSPQGILTYGGAVVWQAYDANNSYATTIYIVSDDGGSPHVLLSDLTNGVFPWAALRANLYWGNTVPRGISRVPLEGGTSEVVVKTVIPAAIAADDNRLYYIESNAIFEVDTDGGAPVGVAWRLPRPGAIAVDDTSIYWTDYGTCDGGTCTGSISKLTPK